MIYIFDLITTPEVENTIKLWRSIGKLLSANKGFLGGQLLETQQSIHPRKDYKLSSFCIWENNDDWQNARAKVKQNTEVIKLLGSNESKFHPFYAELIAGKGFHCKQPKDEMILIDIVYLPPERMDGYINMWNKAKAYMEHKSGYINASLYKTIDSSNEMKFINIAEWQSFDVFDTALNNEEFIAILGEYKNDFALYISKRKHLLNIHPN